MSSVTVDNHLLALDALHNRWFGMRHGESLANRDGVIASAPERGVGGFGLTERGRRQTRRAARNAAGLGSDTRIISSDFKRALETARIVHRELRAGVGLRPHPALRERFFGELEGGSADNYRRVWEADLRNPHHTDQGVESASAVMARVTRLVADLDAEYREQTFLLVAHGDVLQLLQTAMNRKPATEHRALTHLENAEIRLFELAPV